MFYNPLQIWVAASVSYCHLLSNQYAAYAAFWEAVNAESLTVNVRQRYERDNQDPNVLHVHF